MPQCKDTIKINELGDFFQKNNNRASQRILSLLNALKISDKKLGLHTECNATHKSCKKLIILLLFSIFNVKNPNNYANSYLLNLMNCGKDVFYRMLNSAKINWRDINYKIASKLLKTISEKGEQTLPTCLIVDDTDLFKRGFKMEKIGKIYSHVQGTTKLGLKMLSLCFDDGKQVLNVDFSLHGEKGKNGNFGLTPKQLKARKKVTHYAENPDYERITEYEAPKTTTLYAMLRRFCRRKMKADYLLADSWFASYDLIKLVCGLKNIRHYLGLAKFNNTKYIVDGKETSAKKIAQSKRKRLSCRKLHAKYIPVVAKLNDIPVQLFICKRKKNENWRVIITTDLSLSFEKAYEIYARRWNIEVFFKDCKQHLNLGKCQSQSLNSQIATTTISMIQYNLLATAKRFECYETFGELFRAAGIETFEATVTERIWLIIKDIIIDIATYFNVDEDELIEKYLADTEVFTKIINFDFLSNAS